MMQNQSSNEGFETKIQDLAGFWEMVSIQVQEVDKNLDEISLLHDNGWILPQDQVTPAERSSISPLTRRFLLLFRNSNQRTDLAAKMVQKDHR
jgi:hypothetical protein